VLVGVDVGGTYTDAVLLEQGVVRATGKILTKPDLLESVLEALDMVLKEADKKDLERIVISTTVITNLIASGQQDRVALMLIPGYGVNTRQYDFQTKTVFLAGVVDYRGRELISLDLQEVKSAIEDIAAEGYEKVGVVGKFSPRNSEQEKLVATVIWEQKPNWQVELGHLAGAQLNFPRRVVTTHLVGATRVPYQRFVESVQAALQQRDITSEVFILKADGGTMPLDKSMDQPVETIFSGPAASTLGALALLPPGATAVVVDIGGTTTDISLILNGHPLLSSKGAKVNNQLTQVHTLAVKSAPVGGDSRLEVIEGKLFCHQSRQGAAYSMGGPVPTPTDALRVLDLSDLGDKAKALEAMEMLGAQLGLSAMDAAGQVVALVVDSVTDEVNKMFLEWELEPAYRIWELLQKKKMRPDVVIGVGGGAAGFIPQVAQRLQCQPVIPPFAPVANAIGAAVAKPTLQISLRADTEEGFYHIREEGLRQSIGRGAFNEQKALVLAKEKLIEKAASYGLKVNNEDVEVTYQEVFNMVRGWDTTGKLYDFTVQTPRGITCYIGEGGKA
jgi:N-methylhydantoinase A/oxoprolinase/acetone carboxylase beta subunit